MELKDNRGHQMLLDFGFIKIGEQTGYAYKKESKKIVFNEKHKKVIINDGNDEYDRKISYDEDKAIYLWKKDMGWL